MSTKAKLKDRLRNWGSSGGFAITKELKNQMAHPPEPDQEVFVEIYERSGRQHIHFSWIIPESTPAA